MMMHALTAMQPVLLAEAPLSPLFGKVSNITAKLAIIVMVASLGLWVTRQVYVFLKKNGRNSLHELLRHLFIFLRKNHPFFGWIVLATATIHAAYYFLRIPTFTTRIQTGILAWLILCFLVAFGLRYQLSLRRKFFQRSIRLWHVITVIVFLVVLVIHV